MKTICTHLITIVFALCFIAVNVHAETRWIEVELQTAETPEKLVGIIFNGSQSFHTFEARISTVEGERSIIAIPYDSELRAQQELLAYAIATFASGETMYSNVKTTLIDIDRASGFAQSVCQAGEVPSTMQSELSLVANLLKVRAKRRANMKAQLQTQLQGEFLEKMQKYEAGFGLKNSKALSADLPPVEIVDRLNRILHTLKKIPSA